MHSKAVFVLLVTVFNAEALSISANARSAGSKVLTRRKRYVVFPEGSSFSMGICTQISAIGTPADNVILFALNWAVAYDLPNETIASTEARERFETKSVQQRRHRRDLYNKMEIIMDTMGFPGRACVNRAICEAAWKLQSFSGSLVSELLRTVFRQPIPKVYSFEPDVHREHDAAFWNGKYDKNCNLKYPDCSFSLLDIILQSQPVTYN